MKILASWTRIVAIGAMLAALAGGVGMTQKTGPGQIPTVPSAADPFGQNPNTKSKIDAPPFGPTDEKQAALRNEDRQKRLIADTDKLLQLATQLHNDVGKTDQHILSIDVVKRADEIEKLAHNVKERMKG
jgi:hypothetical protein